MTGLAMIMAGGEGQRMANSGGRAPKPLTTIAGVTLLERNLSQLVHYGFDQVVVAVPASLPQIGAFTQQRLAPVAASFGCRVEILTEQAPLGNFGAVQTLASYGQPALVVYADNLAALDLRAIFDFHAREQPSMTIATHEQDFAMPYGVVQLDGSQVLGYREKPVTSYTVCSAICVVSDSAIQAIAPGERLGISEMVVRLVGQSKQVRAFRHAEPWIDVNDLETVARAEALLLHHPERFALWSGKKIPPAGATIRDAQPAQIRDSDAA